MNNMNARHEAYKAGHKFYKTSDPCRRGHMSERYTSTGNCVECMTITAANQRVRNRSRVIQANAGQMPPADHYARMVPLDWHGVFDTLQQIAMWGAPAIKAECREFIEALGQMPSAPGSPVLTTADLARYFVGTVGNASNINDFDVTYHADPYCTHPSCIYMGGYWYEVAATHAAWTGKAPSVAPTTPHPSTVPPTMKGIIK